MFFHRTYHVPNQMHGYYRLYGIVKLFPQMFGEIQCDWLAYKLNIQCIQSCFQNMFPQCALALYKLSPNPWSLLCSDEGLTLETSANTLYGVQHIHISLTLIHWTFYRHADAEQNQFSQGLVLHCIRWTVKLELLGPADEKWLFHYSPGQISFVSFPKQKLVPFPSRLWVEGHPPGERKHRLLQVTTDSKI